MNTQAHAEEAHAGASVGTNMAVWIGLVAITFLEVFLAYEELKPAVMLSILVVLSVVKAGMIMSWFMHLKYEKVLSGSIADSGDDFLHLHDVYLLLPGSLPAAPNEAALR